MIDYSTTWCGPCKLVSPKFDALSKKYTSVMFLKCTGDTDPSTEALMIREGVRSVPAFHVWKSGKKVAMVVGARMDELERAILAAQSNDIK